MGEKYGTYWTEKKYMYRFVGKHEGRRSFGSHSSRWKNNIKVHLTETRHDSVGSVNVTQDRDKWRARVKTAINIRIP